MSFGSEIRLEAEQEEEGKKRKKKKKKEKKTSWVQRKRNMRRTKILWGFGWPICERGQSTFSPSSSHFFLVLCRRPKDSVTMLRK